MSDSIRRLPARPSLTQLRKQAKELRRAYLAGDEAAINRLSAVIPRLADPDRSRGVTLADAQFVLAREYGLENWAKLALHVKEIDRSERLARYEQLARDFVAASQGDAEALDRLNRILPRSLDQDQLRVRVRQRLNALRGSAAGSTELSLPAELSLEDARLFVAQQHGFESWSRFVESFARPPADPRSAPVGLSSTPPFYKIDRQHNTIEPELILSDRDWETIFGVMTELRITGLKANGQLTDAALKALLRLDFVTRLNLGGTKRITDDGLNRLAGMPQLQELDLSDYPGGQITDRGLEFLRHLTGLRQFQMCWQRGISDLGLANLAGCDRLESVNLLGTPTGDGVIRALAGKRRLRLFKTGRLVTDAGLPFLHQFPMFKTWQDGEIQYGLMSFEAEPTDLLLDGPITDRGLANLAGLDGLFGLSFFWHLSALTAGGLKPLADLPRLGYLGCQGELCNDEAMRHIAAIPRLRMLMGQGTVASDDGFTALSRSQTIEYLWGRECPNLGGRGFAALAAMPSLRGLAVSCKNVDDAALSSLPSFPVLRGLMPMDVPDAGFRHIGLCTQLEDLWCMYCRETGDEATEHLTGLSKLKTYYAGQTRITDRSLEILSRLSSLEKIQLEACDGITNAGLALLAGLPRLREICIGGSPRITREGLAVFTANVRADYW
ncbi:MAG TPA: hypothetical protein VJ302_18675 [Blastocatellia bacterium]|nr:hypothetical protein [Blastocatellia bacterium]